VENVSCEVGLDLETMGKKPGCAIMAIGAVRWTLDGTVGDSFSVNITLESCAKAGLEVDMDTVMWWMRQDENARLAWMTNAGSLRDGLLAFSRWHRKGDRVWGNDETFDNAILSAAYDAMGLPTPWKYYHNRCFRTLYQLGGVDHRDYKREGTHHEALADAKHQVMVAQLAYRNLQVGESGWTDLPNLAAVNEARDNGWRIQRKDEEGWVDWLGAGWFQAVPYRGRP
jgi:3' exoribonuclease, RNase T-like